jgi:MSHA biogenesis protein MshJ
MKAADLRLSSLAERIDRLSLRERAILLVLGIALAWALLDALLLQPLARQGQALVQQTEAAGKRIEAADQALAEVARRADPDATPRQRLATLRNEYEARLDATAGLRNSLIPAREMAAMLESLIGAYPGLDLVSLKTLPPEPLGQPAAQPGQPAAVTSALYRHGIELELAGGYADLVGFLRRAERLPRQAFWASAGLDAGEHPRLRLKLRLYTLSQDQTWLAF